MPKPERKLRTRALKRNLGKELLQSVREMKADKRGRVHKAKGKTLTLHRLCET